MSGTTHPSTRGQKTLKPSTERAPNVVLTVWLLEDFVFTGDEISDLTNEEEILNKACDVGRRAVEPVTS
jgi:hypothetical protein